MAVQLAFFMSGKTKISFAKLLSRSTRQPAGNMAELLQIHISNILIHHAVQKFGLLRVYRSFGMNRETPLPSVACVSYSCNRLQLNR